MKGCCPPKTKTLILANKTVVMQAELRNTVTSGEYHFCMGFVAGPCVTRVADVGSSSFIVAVWAPILPFIAGQHTSPGIYIKCL